MSRLFFLCTTFILTSLFLHAQKGNVFPFLEGESLTHGFVNVPNDTKGKHTLIGVALSKKAEDELRSWFDPIYNTFIRGPKEGDLFAFDYDVNIYFIPMFTGAKRPAYQSVMNKVEKTVDKKLHPYVLFYKGSIKDYKDVLNIDDKNTPYFFLLDKNGTIIYSTKGSFDSSKLQKMVDQIPFD